jgi:hypothetical protein
MDSSFLPAFESGRVGLTRPAAAIQRLFSYLLFRSTFLQSARPRAGLYKERERERTRSSEKIQNISTDRCIIFVSSLETSMNLIYKFCKLPAKSLKDSANVENVIISYNFANIR